MSLFHEGQPVVCITSFSGQARSGSDVQNPCKKNQDFVVANVENELIDGEIKEYLVLKEKPADEYYSSLFFAPRDMWCTAETLLNDLKSDLSEEKYEEIYKKIREGI